MMVMVTVLCYITIPAFATKAITEWITYKQPDGSELTLSLWGNGCICCYRDMSGQSYARDSQGVFHLLTSEQVEQMQAATRANIAKQPTPHANWDPNRIYRQLVVLVSFSDCNFTDEHGSDFYNSMFNIEGWNEMNGPGCIVDYFRSQSQGLFNLKFDIVGPIKVNKSAMLGNGYDVNYGQSVFYEAFQKVASDGIITDFSPYDWNRDGVVDQVVIVYAGYPGNQAGLTDRIWPNTATISGVTTPDGYKLSTYSASGELWKNNLSCGIGTICHEFSHCLGLPDLYPTTSGLPPSVIDEWDLMDSGTISNYGWCPPNYSALEKMLLGWHTPVELTSNVIVNGMKPVSEDGTTYIIRNTGHNDEYYLLENRQWQGWDAALPGKGLLVWHVNYSSYVWSENIVNNDVSMPGCHLVTADNMNYMDWRELYLSRGGSRYRDGTNKMNSCIMSSATYPWATDSTTFVNDALTDTSVPSSRTYYVNAEGVRLLSKPITNITQNDDGTVSFTFHASNDPSAIVNRESSQSDHMIFDLYGNRIYNTSILHPGIYIVNGKKRIIF